MPGHEGRRATAVGAPERHPVDDDREPADDGHRDRRRLAALPEDAGPRRPRCTSRIVAVAKSANVALPIP